MPRTRTERGHTRRLVSQFGQVTVTRNTYRALKTGNLHPADAALNLPAGLYSHTLARRLALEVTRGSFDDAVDAVARATGQVLGKRLAVELVRDCAADVTGFYARARPEIAPAGRLLVLQFDGKGIVMRPEALRPATAKAAGQATHRLKTRLSPGEKANRKRMAEIAVVHDTTPAPRTVDDVIPRRRGKAQATRPTRPRGDGPKAAGKWLTASVVDGIATVITAGFDEAQRRDPHHQRTWVVLVDGNNTQIEAIRTEAARRRVTVTIIVDFVHVLEYLWTAAWSFFDKATPTPRTGSAHRPAACLPARPTRSPPGSAAARPATTTTPPNAEAPTPPPTTSTPRPPTCATTSRSRTAGRSRPASSKEPAGI